MLCIALPSRPTSEHPAINWEEEALEVLYNRAEIGLDLHFRSATIFGAREAVVLLCLGEYSLTLPHSLGSVIAELRLIHLSLHFIENILVNWTKYEPCMRRVGPNLGRTRGREGAWITFA